jgi:hypothetical protein
MHSDAVLFDCLLLEKAREPTCLSTEMKTHG